MTLLNTFNLEMFANVNKTLFESFFLENCKLFAITLLLAIPLGLIISFGSMTKFKPLRSLVKTFVWIIRGTPLILQLCVVLYAPGMIFGVRLPGNPRAAAAIIAFAINYACYFSEIYRGGIESIPKGQYEACQVLGMTKSQTFFKVILVQVIKRIVPPMGNEIITLVKDTSLVRAIAIGEIIMQSERYTAKGIIWPMFYTGVFFLLFCGILTILFNAIEKKMDYFKG